MIISLIGMSGIGKTHWSKRLEQEGFHRFSCDDMIEEKLGPELQKLGYAGIHDVARWMGQPFERHYAARSKQYLTYETESLYDIFRELESNAAHTDVVLDVTGSVIYIEPNALAELKKKTTIVYLEATLEYADLLYQRFLEDPKPVIWGSSYKKRFLESPTKALARCYPDLLSHRSREYKKLADITIDYPTHNSFDQNTATFLTFIRGQVSEE